MLITTTTFISYRLLQLLLCICSFLQMVFVCVCGVCACICVSVVMPACMKFACVCGWKHIIHHQHFQYSYYHTGQFVFCLSYVKHFTVTLILVIFSYKFLNLTSDSNILRHYNFSSFCCSNPIFHRTLAYNVASPHQVW